MNLNEQQQQLTRVKSNIGPIIIEFARERLNSGNPEFHAADLRNFVASRSPGAPASPDRVLRDLRQNGELNYEVVNRRGSLYKMLPVQTKGEQQQKFAFFGNAD